MLEMFRPLIFAFTFLLGCILMVAFAEWLFERGDSL